MSDLEWLIDYLEEVNNNKKIVKIYDFNTLRGLMNITMPYSLSDEYYIRQDRYLNELLKEKEIIDASSFNDGLNLYLGDITLIKANAIVNACNSQLLGCFIPNHKCIDNAIHTFAGLELRRDLIGIMTLQGHNEGVGLCKATRGYNLPSEYIFHTVGPIYIGSLDDEKDLYNCYYSCMMMADKMNLKTIVFPSISTGVYGYPIEEASRIAIRCVKKYLEKENKNIKKVIFDVFSLNDYKIYEEAIKEQI